MGFFPKIQASICSTNHLFMMNVKFLLKTSVIHFLEGKIHISLKYLFISLFFYPKLEALCISFMCTFQIWLKILLPLECLKICNCLGQILLYFSLLKNSSLKSPYKNSSHRVSISSEYSTTWNGQ